MLTDANFKKNESEVLEAIEELFDHCIEKQTRENDFLLFLENGHLNPGENPDDMNSYWIGQGHAGMRDRDRMAFVDWFIQIPFERLVSEAKNKQEEFEIRQQSTSLSMMLYTHFWESKVFLRRLRLLAILCEGKEYDWNLVVRPKETYTFIKNEIRGVFENHGLKIYEIIKRTYKSQLRNAFAHSDYYLSGGKVYLENYDKTKPWSIEHITFGEFDEIISLTLLIHHALVTKIDDYKKKLGSDKSDRRIYLPAKGGQYATLHYRATGVYRWLWDTQV